MSRCLVKKRSTKEAEKQQVIIKEQHSKKKIFKEEGMMNRSNAAEDKMGRQWRITIGLEKMLVISDLDKKLFGGVEEMKT